MGNEDDTVTDASAGESGRHDEWNTSDQQITEVPPEESVDDHLEVGRVIVSDHVEYYVERIEDYFMSKIKKDWFLVKWWGWDRKHNTWEITENLSHAQEYIDEFFAQNPRKLVSRKRVLKYWEAQKKKAGKQRKSSKGNKNSVRSQCRKAQGRTVQPRTQAKKNATPSSPHGMSTRSQTSPCKAGTSRNCGCPLCQMPDLQLAQKNVRRMSGRTTRSQAPHPLSDITNSLNPPPKRSRGRRRKSTSENDHMNPTVINGPKPRPLPEQNPKQKPGTSQKRDLPTKRDGNANAQRPPTLVMSGRKTRTTQYVTVVPKLGTAMVCINGHAASAAAKKAGGDKNGHAAKVTTNGACNGHGHDSDESEEEDWLESLLGDTTKVDWSLFSTPPPQEFHEWLFSGKLDDLHSACTCNHPEPERPEPSPCSSKSTTSNGLPKPRHSKGC